MLSACKLWDPDYDPTSLTCIFALATYLSSPSQARNKMCRCESMLLYLNWCMKSLKKKGGSRWWNRLTWFIYHLIILIPSQLPKFTASTVHSFQSKHWVIVIELWDSYLRPQAEKMSLEASTLFLQNCHGVSNAMDNFEVINFSRRWEGNCVALWKPRPWYFPNLRKVHKF